ncbi:MAG: diphthine--ammonia ligase, partial [Nanoarchaeota archaeon]
AKKSGYEISCLISIFSENKDSFMFHTPSIEQVKKQAEVMNIPLVIVKTKGEKEKELLDLERAIRIAIKKYKIKGIVTGAVESVYQSSRIQKICNKMKIECFNPLWQKRQFELLNDLIKNKFEVIVVGVSAEGFDKKWLGRKINNNFIKDIKKLNEKYGINPAGEGGEFESFVISSPLFKRKLKVVGFKDYGFGNSWRRELVLK